MKTKEEKRIYREYSNWKRTSIYSWVESLWAGYNNEKPPMTFEEYVQGKNHYNSLPTALFQIKIWEEVSEERGKS